MLIWNRPQTFQDAVSICRCLQILYLWIDYACILKDRDFDRRQEISRMASVYANSYSTLATSTSIDSSTGCFLTCQDRLSITHVSAEPESLGQLIYRNEAPILHIRRDDSTPGYI